MAMKKSKNFYFTHNYIHRLIYEKQEVIDDDDGDDDDHKQNDFLFKFSFYNGPCHSDHATKKLYLMIEAENEKNKTIGSNHGVQYYAQILNEFLDNLINSPAERKDFSFNLTARLGIMYFYGKSLDWYKPICLQDLQDLLAGKPIPSLQTSGVNKNISINSCFTPYKSIESVNKFVQKISKLGYKQCGQSKIYSLKLRCKTNNNGVMNIDLDENFDIISISDEQSKVWNIDLIRDRSVSIHKIDGTYLDVFDIRVQLTKLKQRLINLKEIGIDLDDDEKILTRYENSDLLLVHKNVDLKVHYLREVNTTTFHLQNVKKNAPFEFASNFKLKIEDLIEYKKARANITGTSGNYFNKAMIANSNITCTFELDKWLKSIDLADYDTTSIIDVLEYFYKDLVEFSNIASECEHENSISKNNIESTLSWFSEVIKLHNIKEPQVVNDNAKLKYMFKDKSMNYETLALIKRINYSRNYLDIFGVNLESEHLDEFVQNDLHEQYKKMLKIIMEDENFDENSINDKYFEKVPTYSKKKSYADGIAKLAITKLYYAFSTLTDDRRRQSYLENLKNKLEN